MGCSTLHIKTEIECRVFLFDEEKGIAKPGPYFNLEVRKGEQDLLFVSTEDETVRYQMLYNVEENDCDYRIVLEKSQFIHYSQEFLEKMRLAEQGDADAQCELGYDYSFGLVCEVNYQKSIEWYTKSAKQGNAEAQRNLGDYYYYGQNIYDGVEQNYPKAVEWYTKSAKQGDSIAQRQLGICYEIGKGISKNIQKAAIWYRKAAEQGDSTAQDILGGLYERGDGVEQDFKEAEKWYRKVANNKNCIENYSAKCAIKRLKYRKLAQQGDAEAQYNLGKCYYTGYGELDYTEAVKWYQESAKQGNSDAQYYLGECYYNGQGVEQDYQKAVKWYTKAAEQGNSDAQKDLGYCYESGQGVKQNYKKAVKWYSKAAEQGNARAQCNLGYCYESGQGVEQKYEKAVEWYTKAAEQGDAGAQNNLGVCYENGDGIEQNYQKAVEWYAKSAEQENECAQNNLGRCYEKGLGVIRNYTKAVKWYRKSAEQGCADAQYNLGNCLEFGRGVEKDFIEAKNWYQKAAEQDNYYAKQTIQRMEYRKAAEQGDAKAQYNLGNCYKYGEGVEENYDEAAIWFRKAAEQGSAEAQRDLGWWYYRKKDDYTEAVKWYRKAAEQGDADAQGLLAQCYKEGNGVEQNYIEAAKWYRIAAEQGDDCAQLNLAEFYEYGFGVEQDYAEAMKWYQIVGEQGDPGYDQAADMAIKRIKRELEKQKKTPYYLFFDTETTGVPRNYNAPASDTNNWPRLVQLGWILTDKDGNTLNEGNEIVRPEGFDIPTDAANVHGITTEKARQVGKPLKDVIKCFLNDTKQVKYLVGHNISFDQRVVGAELYRLGLTDNISNMQSICTMQSTVDFCKIPGTWWDDYKYPKLQELYYELFGCKFEDAHDAMADITATKKCFFELKRIGVIKDE